MINIDVREQLRNWSQTTYAEEISNCYMLKDELIDLLSCDNGLDKAKMDGNSLFGLESAESTDILLSYEFDTAFRIRRPSQNALANYIVGIYERLRSSEYCNRSLGDKIRIMNKALLSFHSFIREMDLAYKLQEYFAPEECYRSAPERDIKEHTDIIFVYKGNTYRIWSYCISSNSGMTVPKLEGKHGSLPSGLHMLCPIDVNNAKQTSVVEGWKLYSDEYINDLDHLINRGQIINYNVLRSNVRSFIGKQTLFEVK